jgi:hypothetical protein
VAATWAAETWVAGAAEAAPEQAALVLVALEPAA